MTTIEDIGEVVADALMSLSPELRQVVVDNQYFITKVVYSDSQQPEYINGWKNPARDMSFIVIDCTKKFRLQNYGQESLQSWKEIVCFNEPGDYWRQYIDDL